MNQNVRDYSDLAYHFFESGQETVRHEAAGGGQAILEEVVWKVRLGTFDVVRWNEIEDTWTELPEFTRIMRATTRRVVTATAAGIERRWANRQAPAREAVRDVPARILGWYEAPRPDELRPTRRARFKAAAAYELFSVYTLRSLVPPWQWQKGVRPSFLVYETAPSPEGHVVVSAGDFNTAAVMRDAMLNRPVKAGEVELPRRKGLLSVINDFPTEDQLSGDQLIGSHAIRNGLGRRSTRAPTSPEMWGWVEVFELNFGGNVDGTALAILGDLEFE